MCLEFEGVTIIELSNGLYLLDELNEIALTVGDAMNMIKKAWKTAKTN